MVDVRAVTIIVLCLHKMEDNTEATEIRVPPEYTWIGMIEKDINDQVRDHFRLQDAIQKCEMVQAQPRIPWSPPQKQAPRAELIWKQTKAGNVRVGHFVCFKEFDSVKSDKRNFANRPLLVTATKKHYNMTWGDWWLDFDFTYKKQTGHRHCVHFDELVYVVVGCNPISQSLL